MKATHTPSKARFGELLRRKFGNLISIEGSLSLMLPPGLDQPGLAGSELIETLLEHRR